MCTLLCVCPARVESLCPPVLSKSCNQIPLAFKVWFSRNFSSCCRTPRLRNLTWGSEPSLHWVDFCGISVLQSESPTQQLWDLILLWLHPSYHLTVAFLCLWMWDIFFGEVQCLPVDDCPAASCDSGVLARGSESSSFYFAILVPIKLNLFSFFWNIFFM